MYLQSTTMATHSTEIVTETQLILTALRRELKKWEKSFAATHEGRKPGREDIKQCPEIGISYTLPVTGFLKMS